MIELAIAQEIVKEQSINAWNMMKDYLIRTHQEHLICKMGEMPIISWKKFGFRMAGRYCYYCFKDNINKDKKVLNDFIEMNINFLTVKDVETFLKDTIRHELAHCINKRVCNGDNHDKTWKNIARIIGDSGEIYHQYGRAKSYNSELKKQIRAEMTVEMTELYNELSDEDFE